MYENIREEELKNKIAQAYFPDFDSTQIIGNIDFSVTIKKDSPFSDTESVLWAEAKKGKSDIFNSITQLILTVGKAHTFDKILPPAYLGAFDAEKIAFVPYNDIQEIFYLNDFNWNVTPSNYETKEFKMVLEKTRGIIETNSLQFFYENDNQELREFIKINFVSGKSSNQKIRIDKNNFVIIYNKWLQTVKPTIAVGWDIAKKAGIIDGDFYLADLLSSENETLKEKLYVLLKKNHYELDKKLDDAGFFDIKKTSFIDKQKAHQQFWNKYERPPREEYWDYIVERRDLLVPQDVRERKGSFYTPQIWVELSQKYLADVLGEDWQDKYYIWDCAAGTGNLLTGLINKDHIWASTLDRQDVDVMRDRIKNGANLLEKNVFQFDFLNDSFEKLPTSLQKVINDPKKQKKLLIYINPPYAEATTAKTVTKTGKNKAGVAKNHATKENYKSKIGNAANEIFALFMARIYEQFPLAKLAQFSKLKFVQGTNFSKFRDFFLAKYLKGFIVRANSFDNVTGNFPIGFTIWDLNQKEKISEMDCDVVAVGLKTRNKHFFGNLSKSINRWIKFFDDKDGKCIGFMGNPAPDFQHKNQLYLSVKKGIEHFNFWCFTRKNIKEGCIYFAVRHCIKATWINDRDQFLYPNEKWKKNKRFQNNCLAFTLFHGQNRISSKDGINHWIPFTEKELDTQDDFDSNFMTDFIAGKIKDNSANEMFKKKKKPSKIEALEFSAEAQAVFDAGREVWKYYHSKINETNLWGMMQKGNVNASLYDIREYFQGRNEKGKMNSSSADEKYSELMAILRAKMQVLANKIEPKIYEYGFLKE